MKVALIQQHATPGQAGEHRAGLRALEAAAAGGAQLVCFAELAFEPFYPQHPAGPDARGLAEPVPGPIDRRVRRARRASSASSCVLNLFERDGDAHVRLLAGHRRRRPAARPHAHDPHHRVRLLSRAGLLHAGRHRRAGVSRRAPGESASPSATTGTIPSTCARWRVAGAELVVVPQAGSVGEWPEGLYEAEMRVAAFQNGYFVALCNRVGQEECLTFARRVVRLRAGRHRHRERAGARGRQSSMRTSTSRRSSCPTPAGCS